MSGLRQSLYDSQKRLSLTALAKLLRKWKTHIPVGLLFIKQDLSQIYFLSPSMEIRMVSVCEMFALMLECSVATFYLTCARSIVELASSIPLLMPVKRIVPGSVMQFRHDRKVQEAFRLHDLSSVYARTQITLETTENFPPETVYFQIASNEEVAALPRKLSFV